MQKIIRSQKIETSTYNAIIRLIIGSFIMIRFTYIFSIFIYLKNELSVINKGYMRYNSSEK